MQRNRFGPRFRPLYNQISQFKVPQQSYNSNQHFPNWQWRGRITLPNDYGIAWRNPCHTRPFNNSFGTLNIRNGVRCLPFQSGGRKLRRLNCKQFYNPRPSSSRFPNVILKKRRRPSKSSQKSTLNPNDPLNLKDLINETDRRRTEGLSPLRGDSRFNTPAPSLNSDTINASPSTGPCAPDGLANFNAHKVNEKSNIQASRGHCNGRGRYFSRSSRKYRWQSKRLPVTGNYPDYYSRRDPEDRIRFLMPEWFLGCDVADYGCHNGTLIFRILEKFPDINTIDAFDCDAELIANAKSMQREKIRWDPQTKVKYEKINFQVADWSNCLSSEDEPAYNTILAFSVTKWIHLNYGDAGLMRFFRRVFNLLKPGGHLLLEPQPKSSYKKTRFTPLQQANFKALTIDLSNLEPLLLDVGFSYFDTIKVPQPHEAFQRSIILCSKSYGVTPSSIRNDCRSETELWRASPTSDGTTRPPPVSYLPLTPNRYSPVLSSTQSVSASNTVTHTPDCFQSEIVSSTVTISPTNEIHTVSDSNIPTNDTNIAFLLPDSTTEQ